MKFSLLALFVFVSAAAFAAPSQISVIVDGQQYQCLGGGPTGQGAIVSCYCTPGNNQLYMKAIFAGGQKLEKMLVDYDDITVCQNGITEHPTCRKTNVASAFFTYCSCESGNNQLWKYIYNQEASEIDRQMMVDYDDPAKCMAGLKANPGCFN